LLKPAVKLYGRILFGTMRGVYGVALWLLAHALSYLVKVAVGKAPQGFPPQRSQMLHRVIPIHNPNPLRTIHLRKSIDPGRPIPDHNPLPG
ncbi:MAG: hypothetical protein QXT16_09040, partial [Candidatus Caldarchaeum sp.]